MLFATGGFARRAVGIKYMSAGHQQWGMELATVGLGVAAFSLIVLADRIDAVVDVLWSSDNPLTDFDPSADTSAEDGSADDGTAPFDDS